MTTTENTCLTNDKEKVSSMKRFITVASDDEEKEIEKDNKRQRSSSLTKVKPLQLINKQPVIRNTRQTSLSIVRTTSDDKNNEERKWNLKMIASSSNQSSLKQSKKKMIQTVTKTPLSNTDQSLIYSAIETFNNI